MTTNNEMPHVCTWESENDDGSFILFNDNSRIPHLVSHSVRAGQSVEAFEQMFQLWKRNNIQADSFQNIILNMAGTKDLDDFLMNHLNVVGLQGISLTFEQVEEYKRILISGMEKQQKAFAALNIITYNVHAKGNTLITDSYNIKPLVDIFSHRIQVCTPKGVILVGNKLHMAQSKLIGFVFKHLGLKVIGTLPDPLKMSGADYVPAGNSLCFMGVGFKTDEASIRWMMRKDLFGCDRIAVVRDLFDRSENRLHLEDVFKLVSSSTVVVNNSIVGKENLNRRLVNEYVRNSNGKYQLHKMDIEFGEYLHQMGFKVIVIPDHIEGMPVYNLGNANILVSDETVANLLKEANFEGKITQVKADLISIWNHTWIFRRSSTSPPPQYPPIPERIDRVWDTNPTHRQTTNTVLMVAPVGFQTNEETAVDNYFMHHLEVSDLEIESKALKEFSSFHLSLTNEGVVPVLFCNERFYNTPDAVFPNNWFSTHSSSELSSGESSVVFYPMKTPSRRAERREMIVSELQHVYKREFSFVQWENSDFPHFLESTGALILDRINRVAYAVVSQRCYKKIAHTWAHKLGYELIMFKAMDAHGHPIYHTNVLMSVGTSVAIACLECITKPEDRQIIKEKLIATGHEVVEITFEQVTNFCGNTLELSGSGGRRLMVMSTRAYNSYTKEQKDIIERNVDKIVHVDINIIETIGGGGVRCMMGEIF